MPANSQRQLQRAPQVFSKVLELPLQSDAHVLIEDRSDCFRFIANIQNTTFSGHVKAHALQIHPEVMKVVVRGGNGKGLSDKLGVEEWRYRLPESTRPELATAFVIKQELIVTVPKGGLSIRIDDDDEGAIRRRIFI